jgi:hypothetical protein
MSAADTSLRKGVYALLITVAAGAVAGRILAVERVWEPSLSRSENEPKDERGLWPKTRPEPMPTFGANDRSRWVTVRSLVEEGTYVIGRRDKDQVVNSAVCLLGADNSLEEAVLAVSGYYTRIKSDSGLTTVDGWGTIDKVLNPETLEFYSSKPPLLSTLVAGLYWVLFHLGWTFAETPWTVVRVILLLVNWLPFVVYLILLARLLERQGQTDWGRFYVLAAGCFGTFVTTFAITLNNHTVATCCALFALYPALRLWSGTRAQGEPETTQQMDKVHRDLLHRLGLGEEEEVHGNGPSSPWSLFVLSGFFAALTACNELPAASFAAALGLLLFVRFPLRTLAFFVPAALIPVAGLLATNYLALHEWTPAYEKFGTVWYEYEGSHWRKPAEGEEKRGVDWARLKETREEYALHLLVGHHGLFSLSPIWLLSLVGIFLTLLSWRRGLDTAQTVIAGLTLVLSVVVIGFYLYQSDNYGGWTSGLRWLMWLSPLWLLSMLPLADKMAERRWSRGLAYLLLAVSVLSVSYPAWNPWRHPWLYNWMDAQGWIPY